MASPEEKPLLKKPAQPRPQWAWLPQDRWSSVHIVVVQDLDTIFLRLNYFSDCLEKLSREIQKYARTQKKRHDCKNILGVGDVCLARPSESDEWNRAVIKSKKAEDKVELFFADFGDIDVVPWDRVMPISNQLITQLPFQVIECCFAALKFVAPQTGFTEWEDEVIDTIYNLSRNELEEALILTAKVCSVETEGIHTSGKRYRVVLANCNVKPIAILNSQLVSSGYAQLSDAENLLDNIELPETIEHDYAPEADTPSPSSLAVVPVMPSQAVVQSFDSELQEFDRVENDRKVAQFLKDLEEGDFEYVGLEDDADISDMASEGSDLSLPRPMGSLPNPSSSSVRALPLPETEDSVSFASNTISSSLSSSTFSLNPEKNKEPTDEKQHIHILESMQSKTDFTNSKQDSLPNTLSTASKILSNCSKAVSGVAHSFREMISPTLLGSRSTSSSSSLPLNLLEKVSPFVSPRTLTYHGSEVANCEDLDDSELDTTITGINAKSISKTVDSGIKRIDSTVCKSNINLDENMDDSQIKSPCELNEATPCKESGKEQISPCQKWVEGVIADSDEDLSFITENALNLVGQTTGNQLEVRTPLVEWHQDDSFVFLRIKLPALSDYKFKSDVTSVYFSAIYGGVPYEVHLPELFGGHKPENVQIAAQACYLEIKLEKLLKGKKRRSHWPRLTKKDEKFHWLKLNAEKFYDSLAESDDEDVKRLACSLPLWNDNPTDSISVASSDRSELANSELSL